MRLSVLPLFLILCACQNPDPATTESVEKDALAVEENLVSPADTTGIPLLVVSFADSAQLVAGWKPSPLAVFHVNTFAARSADEALNTLINTALANVIAEQEAPMQTTDLRKVVVNAVKTRLFEYENLDLDTTEVSESPQAWMLDIHYTTKVRHNANGLLTLATSSYAYTGGAHGNFATTLHVFDLAAGRQLSYEDLFQPYILAELGSVLLGLTDKTALFDDEALLATTNIGLVEDGIIFNYSPYEIAPYAAGEIEIVLPYAKLAPYLTATGEVVARRIGGL